ncbi:Piso0_005735 [Millerozyma farinosa CBS 7064]|uniref:Piso0_005735 protein n=1 Tax=Pichia sorbitophila (strain ATCC MYA-4447 / BCRC 22081 / CBS 7064 / NBRC 10061 / NRRL Y-12695) TaxID=559304 RepID=G8Y2S5_PICSO|nr:Piso0_005735 [Millerozyma farinosa CBS 7064]
MRGLRVHRRLLVLLLLSFLGGCFGSIFQDVNLPEINMTDYGGELGFYGNFDGVSIYDYMNASDAISNEASDGHENLYIRTLEPERTLLVSAVNGRVYQMLPIDKDLVIINGNFTQFKNKSVKPPIIYDYSKDQVTSIFSDQNDSQKGNSSVTNGDVKVLFQDDELVYLGGDFEFNGTYGAAIYNLTSKKITSTKFQGFGKNSVINSIIKINDSSSTGDDHGSIIFGGKFNTLGLKDLLVHNVTKDSNDTNSSLIEVEQVVSLRNGIFTNVNGDGDDKSLICPSQNPTWSVTPNSGGQWAVELPDEMKGLYPSKVRLYTPDGSDSVQSFRIYTYPNNGIMNLSYIDPSTNSLLYCDSTCTLGTKKELSKRTQNNTDNIDDFNSDKTYVDPDDGSFAFYYDPSSKTKTVGYGPNYQEFSLQNNVAIDKIGVTITSWHGSKGVLAGFELYTDTIFVYGNDTLNLPNCDEDDELSSYSEVKDGKWVSVKELSSVSVQNNDYLVTEVDTSSGKHPNVMFYPNITYSGDYSIIMITPGCLQDDSCNSRSIVNVTMFDREDKILTSKLIYQNNDYDKFDYLFSGHLNGSSSSDERNKVQVSFHEAIDPNTEKPWIVVDKIRSDIISLDSNIINSTNHTINGTLRHINLNGLFEYSLANFSRFSEDLVSKKTNTNKTIISKNNTFVSNSTINLLGAQLNSDAEIKQLYDFNSSHEQGLLLVGNFKSDNSSLDRKSVINLSLSKYNSSSNESEATLHKRDSSSTFDMNGLSLNDSVSKVQKLADGLVFIGKFSAKANSSVHITDLSNQNKSASTLNNFALYSSNKWYSFGNEYSNIDFNQVHDFKINDTEYYVFSSTHSSTYCIWDSKEEHWANSSSFGALLGTDIDNNTQIVSGFKFFVMQQNSIDEAFVNPSNKLTLPDYDISYSFKNIEHSWYINKTLSVLSGDIELDYQSQKLVLVSNNKTLKALDDNIKWDDKAVVQSLTFNDDFMFVGTNGSVKLKDDMNLTGVLIYDLKNKTSSKVQPAVLSNNGKPIEVNSMVYYDQSDQLLVAGDFTSAGSLECQTMCIYDITNTRWNSPFKDSSPSLSGVITAVQFYSSNEVLISGNLTVNNKQFNFITYNFQDQSVSTSSVSELNSLSSKHEVRNFVFSDVKSDGLSSPMIAYGSDFVSFFNGSGWQNIDKDFVYSDNTSLKDTTFIESSKHKGNSKAVNISNNKLLILAGKFELSPYGHLNTAIFNGSHWFPYLFSSKGKEYGTINSIHLKDVSRIDWSARLENQFHKMSRGKVVGISLACAIGSTMVVGLLYLIPALLFLRNNKERANDQRIEEKEMMEAVKPTDLFHEIDLHRHS